MKSLKSTLLLIALCGSQISSAQIGNYFDKFRPAKRWSVGLQLSPTHGMTDADNFVPGISFGAHVKYSVSQTFGLKFNADIGTINGNREDQDISGNGNEGRNGRGGDQTRGGSNTYNAGNSAPSEDSYFYKNNFKDMNVNMVFTLGNISFLRPLRKYQLFLFTGFGVVWSDARGEFTNPTDAEAYYNRWGADFFTPEYDNNNNFKNAISRYQGQNFTIPFGVGVKRNISDWLDLGIEYRNHYTRTDNLDAYSYPIWRNRVFDFYGLLGFQASIKLGGKDGITDHYDWLNPVESIYSTLDSLQEIKGKVDLLLLDTDGDGVADYYDKEPDTEKDAWVWGSGETADIDEDGVPDYRDDQPFSEKGATVNAAGVMIDEDNDNVPDYRDEDPRTIQGSVVSPTTGKAVKVGGGGCCDCNDVILPAVVFDNGSATIKPEFYGVLYSVAEKMKQCPDLKVTATGYSVKSKSGDQLAYKRANAIIDYLNANYNIPRDRFKMNAEGKASSDMEYTSRRIDLSKTR
ncbi:MAG: OmpA family protein [Flavobacteriales bacterium]|nr:OmpA family protein [Flavobacteriales bacterium]